MMAGVGVSQVGPMRLSMAPANTSVVQNGGQQQLVLQRRFFSGAASWATSGTNWVSSSPAVASVSANGLVTAGATLGIAIISASSGPYSGSTLVNVVSTPTQIDVLPLTPSLPLGNN